MEADGRIANAEGKGRKGMRAEAPQSGRDTGRRRGPGQDRMRVGTAQREGRGRMAAPVGAHANAVAEVAAAGGASPGAEGTGGLVDPTDREERGGSG